jgi:hypothetical protein
MKVFPQRSNRQELFKRGGIVGHLEQWLFLRGATMNVAHKQYRYFHPAVV